MKTLFYNITGLGIYIFGFIPFSGYIGYYSLDEWHQKWGQKISKNVKK